MALKVGVPERRLLGWTPAERHEHFDAQGKLTGWTVVTREAEWDEAEVEKMLELALHDSGMCECGQHRDLTNDPDAQFQIKVEKCDTCATLDRFLRIQHAKDESAIRALGRDPAPEVERPEDGRRISVELTGFSSK